MPGKIIVAPDGSYYFTDSDEGYVHHVTADGVHYRIAGGGTNEGGALGAPARSLSLDTVESFGLALNGANLLVTDPFFERVITVRPSSLPGVGASDMLIASSDGSELYQFDAQGRHQTTRDTMTGAIRYQFAYESHGYLASVADAYGNVTSIQRDPAGNALAIIGPFGQATQLAYDANGYLGGVTNPLGQSVGMTYTPTGLLTSFQNARGAASSSPTTRAAACGPTRTPWVARRR